MDFSAMSILSAVVEIAIIGAIELSFARRLPRTRRARVVAIAGLGLFLALVLFVDLSTFPKPQMVREKFFGGGFSLAEVEMIQMGTAMIAILLGWTAHWFKQIDQMWFGNFEVLFGIATAFQSARAFGQDSTAFEVWLALGASAYIIQRGLGNRRDGAKTVAAVPPAKPEEILAAAT